MDACHQAWLSRSVSDRILAKATSRSIVDDLAAALRPRYARVTAVDGKADGGVDVVASRSDRTVLIQVKHWRRRMSAFEAKAAVDKIVAHYPCGARTHVWIVSRNGFSFSEGGMEWPVPVKLWKTDDLIRACNPRCLPNRMPRDRHLRLRAMREAGRRHA